MQPTKSDCSKNRYYPLMALCVTSLMLTAPAVQAEKVVVIPLGKTTNIAASIFWTGEWQDNFQYALGDGMQYEGSSYLCIKDHLSSQTNTPPNETYWSLMAEKGDTGPQGEQGLTGPQGAVGPIGPQGPAGQEGAVGQTGPQGPAGPEGAVGQTGPQGEQGPEGPAGTSSWADGAEKVTTEVNVGIGTNSIDPAAKLDIDGEIMLRQSSGNCDEAATGKIRWSGTDFEGCNGNIWVSLTYNPKIPTVTSITGRVWMDRNLGASQVATAIDDEAAYGGYFQWGRGSDGHELSTSEITTTVSTSDDPGHSQFIFPYSTFDWRNPSNDQLWQPPTFINNPCPAGFRIPTREEWDAESLAYAIEGITSLYNSPLKLPVAGYRDFNGQDIESAGVEGYYWTSDIYYTITGIPQAFVLGMNSTLSTWGQSEYRATGLSVRCIKIE